MELLAKIQPNPDNPRRIDKEDFKRLKASLKDLPKMLSVRPIAYDSSNNYVVLGGNQRLMGLKKLVEEGFEVRDEWFVDIADWTEEEKRQFIIKDNISNGKWDYDLIANNWSDSPLAEWGLDIEGWLRGQEADPNAEWEGMPEFDGETAFNAFRSVMVHFKTEADFEDFCKIMNQKLTEKTKYIWHPFRPRESIIDKTFKSE